MKVKQQYTSQLQVVKRSSKELAIDQMYFNGQY